MVQLQSLGFKLSVLLSFLCVKESEQFYLLMLDHLKYMAIQSAMKQILINYFLMFIKANVAPISASRKPSSDYVAYANIIWIFHWILAFIW